ncbi:MAG TPA: hypothetical protein VHM90_15815 [Phycisphaerae bacterium]|nr:hypothetical protein [Phycisphaerae bacterium]
MVTATTGGSGQISDPKIFFCQSQPDETYAYYGNDKTSNWLDNSAGNSANGNPHMGYQYDLHLVSTPVNGNYPVPYRKLGQFPKNMSLLNDLINSPTSIAHLSGKTEATWNMAFSDSHVDAVKSRRMTSWLNSHPGDITGSNQGSYAIWQSLAPEITDLERLAGS